MDFFSQVWQALVDAILNPRIDKVIEELIVLVSTTILFCLITSFIFLIIFRIKTNSNKNTRDDIDPAARVQLCFQGGALLGMFLVCIVGWLGNFSNLKDITAHIVIFVLLVIFFTLNYFSYRGYVNNLKKIRFEKLKER